MVCLCLILTGLQSKVVAFLPFGAFSIAGRIKSLPRLFKSLYLPFMASLCSSVIGKSHIDSEDSAEALLEALASSKLSRLYTSKKPLLSDFWL